MVNVLIGVTGSVATIKIQEVVDSIHEEFRAQRKQLSVIVVRTSSAVAFMPVNLEGVDRVVGDSDEWQNWKQKGDPILHIDLRKWADILVIAPLDANSLGKLANGLCDNLLTSVARAWEIGKKPFVVAPAMNTLMWNHPITEIQLKFIRDVLSIEVILPLMNKKLACGDTGPGAMEEPKEIAVRVYQLISDRCKEL